MPDDYNGTPVPENQNPDPGNGEENNNIPDWMKEAGWETSSGTFDESKPVFDDLDDDEDEIVPADIPAWLEEAAPEGFSSDPNATPAFEGLDVDEPFITTGDLVPPPSMEPPVQEQKPEQVEESVETEDTEAADESQAPLDGPDFDIPSWLENLELHEDSQETAIAWLENMPESLRATEDELQAAQDIPLVEPDVIEEPVDELAWVDETSLESDPPSPTIKAEQAHLSEDLVASELIPEAGDGDQIFRQDEIRSMDSELPSWLKELGDDQADIPESLEEQAELPSDESEELPPSQEESMPDWLTASEEPQITDSLTETPVQPPEPVAAPPAEGSDDIPDWLGEFEADSADSSDPDETAGWLDSLGTKEIPQIDSEPIQIEDLLEESPTEESEQFDLRDESPLPADSPPPVEDLSHPDGVSANDETLNAQVPEWLSKIGETEDQPEDEPLSLESFEPEEEIEIPVTESGFDTTSSWLDQISEKPLEDSSEEAAAQDSEVVDWLQEMGDQEAELPAEDELEIPDFSQDQIIEETPVEELDTSQYFALEEASGDESSDDLPDWLSELGQDEEQSLSLEDAIRLSDHDLNEEEVDFLSKKEEKQEEDADWLSKLDQIETQPDFSDTSPPAIEMEPITETEGIQPAEEEPEDPSIPGGMLDRLRDTAEFKSEEEVPQWLSDIKEEEDPQETAVLWLQQFVNQGGSVDFKNEIKRYTDELDPGVAVPKWMEDLKNEEDPQTTAMLWLEKLSADRQQESAPEPTSKEEDSGWLADLEREAAESEPAQAQEEVTDFDDPDQAWLSDLEIDEKLKPAEDDLPEWSKPESEGEAEEAEPPWMKATSPLEGDFYTDELAGGEEKEVEIPEWLAGYAEGEAPDKDEDEISDDDEYTWLAASDATAAPRTPLDLNKAAISQLESILGISHQIARGIVTHREKHGPYRGFEDLKDVPEIVDEQTIDILKPEVIISEVPEPEPQQPPVPEPDPEPAPPQKKPAKKPAAKANFEEVLVTARARINERKVDQAAEQYSLLIKKKKFLTEIIEDLKQAALDFPLEIAVYQTLGDAFMQKDMLDKALEAYSKAEDLLS